MASIFDILKNTFSYLSLDSANIKGSFGEQMTVAELNMAKKFGADGLTLRNVYIPKPNGDTTEIDIIFITTRGLFVIESKDYSGWIFGDGNERYWTASLPNGVKNRFYSPIMQNDSHIKYLMKYLTKEVPCHSFIVFSDRCTLQRITNIKMNISVLKRHDLINWLLEVWNRSAVCFTDYEVQAVYNVLVNLTKVTSEQKRQHIQNIKEKYSEESTNTKCPWCGGELVLRTSKQAKNYGNSFYGCKNYPRCKFVRNVKG